MTFGGVVLAQVAEEDVLAEAAVILGEEPALPAAGSAAAEPKGANAASSDPKNEGMGPAPDFKAAGIDGVRHELKQYKGKYLVLEWFNPDCPFVKKHYDSGNMQALQKKYTDMGVVWLTVNSSAPGKQGHYDAKAYADFMDKAGGSPSAVLLDHDGRIGRRYGAKTTPHLFVINPGGYLIYQGAIDDKPSADAADVPGSKNYVAAALDEAMSKKAVSSFTTEPYGCSVKY